MFTQKEDHLQEGNMLIHSWYRLGRGTPHRPVSGVTCHPRQRWNERLAGNYRKPWPPWPGNPEISNPQLFLHESLWDRRLCVDISIHDPAAEAENPRPHLCHTPARSQTRTLPRCSPPQQVFHQLLPLRPGPAIRTPTSAQWVQKGPEMMSKILELL